MADDQQNSLEKVASPNPSEEEIDEEREEVLLLESDSEDDSDSERKPVEKERREIPVIDPRIDKSLSEIVGENVKRYENKNSAKFVTGLDITSKEARRKREARAKRFGTASKSRSGEAEEEEEEEDISSVLLAQGSTIGGNRVRLEAINMTGVDDMSTQDIFSYFQSYDPSSIEWINDTSCNIVWLDPHSAARALLGMSKPREGYFRLGLKNLAQCRHLIDEDQDPLDKAETDGKLAAEQEHSGEGDQEPEPMEEGGDDEDDTFDLVSDRETGEKVRPSQRIIPTTTSTSQSHSNFGSRTEREEGMEGVQLADEDLGPVDITHDQALRIGLPHPSAQELLLRYATIDDRKERGAYRHSQYYIKYGNPNFGGMKGLISESMKKKIRQGKYVPGQARKRRYREDSDGEREEEREEWPRKRRVPGRMERRLGERETDKQQNSPPHSNDEHGQDSGGEDLVAEVRHALRERDAGRDKGKMSRRMYADEIEDEIKKIRQTSDVRPQQPTEQVVADARERLRQGRDRLSIKNRLGGGVAHSVTPAPSMENLKIILDVNERVSPDAWGSSGEEDAHETLVVEEDYEDEDRLDDLDLMTGVGSDLRSRLNRRRPDTRPRPGFGQSEQRPAFLENLPSLQIEIREEM
ncbi:uncharacterized protein [Diadema setosum]|uniref:uncharacterized protein n=1 Tax=Diadema setosum TaxID=31175 RepID=UPI003B3A214C